MTFPDSVTQAARAAAIRSKAIQAAEEYVRRHLWALEDATVNTLGQLYLEAYREMASALTTVWLHYGSDAAWSASDAAFRARTDALMGQIAAEVARLTDAATALTFEQVVRSYQGGYYGRGWVLETGLRGAGAVYTDLLPVAAIRAAMLAPYQGSTFLDRFADARDEFVQRVRKSIVESQIRGESIGQASKRLREALGITRADPKGLWARTEMIARTEILRASNLGAMEFYRANTDVLEGWEWLATNDERTCPICGPLDGQRFEMTSRVIPPPRHPNCRCTVVPVLIDRALEERIVGPRQTYAEWAAERGITVAYDGGVFSFRGAPAPKSQTPAARAVANY